ncbi:MAG: pyruvate dehydrogenase (acetyl-transferring), homodimeric type [Spirochaetia bacterium]|nr:pyruvate dehydrogenase (acetyl-transferring), homodimeric type [Spirochaetia bacterium]
MEQIHDNNADKFLSGSVKTGKADGINDNFSDSADDIIEGREWVESLEYVIKTKGSKRVISLLRELQNHAASHKIHLPYAANTPYVNTIPAKDQPAFPGDRDIERRIKSIIRWNAMAMVVRANRENEGIGGHISTYASAATLYEVAFNHFFKGKNSPDRSDLIFFQGHASPGIYARAYLEGKLSEENLKNFRKELQKDKGLSSYPHPYLMPDFWEFPTVSMGLGPIMAIYQARFNRYLEDRGHIKKSSRVWAFLGDGETDEPEALGAISLAGREKLDNLIFVINCNLQRLDGPVRGNGKIIQELERVFRGAGWNVLKVIWGSNWDPLLEKDGEGVLLKKMEDTVDGQYQKYSIESGGYIRENFFGGDKKLASIASHLSDLELQKLARGGHDPIKVYTAYKAAVSHKGTPTVILAKTIKGYGLGDNLQGKNYTHQQKKMDLDEIREFRNRFAIPVSDDKLEEIPFYRPPENSPEMKYLRERRITLGGYVPRRCGINIPFEFSDEQVYDEFFKGSREKAASTTMVLVRLLTKLMGDKNMGNLIVPIVPDEARTFGMEALFNKAGIYSHVGQNYEPVDKNTLLYYREAKDGQILEEGINEAGAMSSFIAAGTSHSQYGVNTIPFFLFYSMFGFQRVMDLIWAAQDMKARGFLIGATAGRTTLNGEGLQHQDGHSHVLALPHPKVAAYDPAYAYETAVIVKEYIRRMYGQNESLICYITVTNEAYPMPAIPKKKDIEEKIIRGIYKLESKTPKKAKAKINLFGSGSLLNETLKAADILRDEFSIESTVFSVTSYKEIYKDCVNTERENMLKVNLKQEENFLQKTLKDYPEPVVAVSDYSKILPNLVARFVPNRFISLGTDGFGRSETREALRNFFEVDFRHIAAAALKLLANEKKIPETILKTSHQTLNINPEKANPSEV